MKTHILDFFDENGNWDPIMDSNLLFNEDETLKKEYLKQLKVIDLSCYPKESHIRDLWENETLNN